MHDPQMQAPSEAGDSDAGDLKLRRSQRAKAEVWKGRATIIEEMNELLDELDVRSPPIPSFSGDFLVPLADSSQYVTTDLEGIVEAHRVLICMRRR